MNILQASDDIETSAMDCANLRPDGEYLRPEDPERVTQGSESVTVAFRHQDSDAQAFGEGKPCQLEND